MLNQILQKLNVDGNVIVKKAWGHMPAYTYSDVITRLLASEGKIPVTDIFVEMSKPTSRDLLKKVFNRERLHGGHNWYAHALSLINKRQCTTCKNIKETTEYYKDNRSYDGCRSVCIECDQAYKDMHRRANLGQYAATASKYRANKHLALVPWADTDEIKAIYDNCPEGKEVDHIIPIQGTIVCGLHCKHNLQYLPVSDNRSKSNKFDTETYIHTTEYIQPYALLKQLP